MYVGAVGTHELMAITVAMRFHVGPDGIAGHRYMMMGM